MHSTSADPPTKPKIVVEDYTRMETGGWIALGLGMIGAAVLLTVGFVTHAVVPTGTAALTMGMFLSGCILLVGRLNLRKTDQLRVELEDHKADHTVAQIDAQDLASIRRQSENTAAIVARWDLERAEERKTVAQVEAFLLWLARAKQRAEERRQSGEPWGPTDDAWLDDVAQAFDLGKQMGSDPS